MNRILGYSWCRMLKPSGAGDRNNCGEVEDRGQPLISCSVSEGTSISQVWPTVFLQTDWMYFLRCEVEGVNLSPLINCAAACQSGSSWSVQRPPQISRLGRGLAKSDDLDALPVAIAAGEVDSRFADGRKWRTVKATTMRAVATPFKSVSGKKWIQFEKEECEKGKPGQQQRSGPSSVVGEREQMFYWV